MSRRWVWLPMFFLLFVQAGPLRIAPRPLLLGEPWERDLLGTDVHEYALDVRQGWLEHLRATQLGVDLTLEVRKEGEEEPTLIVDSRNGSGGVEELWWVPKEEGRYSLRIQPLPNTSGGRYRLEVLERRPVQRGDQQRANAILALHAAHLERVRRAPSFRHRQRSRIHTAACLWSQAGERYQEALAWLKWADLSKEAGHTVEALPAYELAVETFSDLGEVELEINTLFALGQGLRFLGKSALAWEVSERARRLALGRQDRSREAVALGNQATLLREQGELHLALEHIDASIEIHRQEQRALDLPSDTLVRGQILRDLGRYEEAEETFEEASELASLWKRSLIYDLSLGELGWLAAYWNDFDRAERLYGVALDGHRKHQRERPAAGAMMQLGKLAQKRGRPEEALAFFKEAEASFTRQGAPRSQAHALLSQAQLHLEEERRVASLEVSQKALELLEKLSDPGGLIWARYLKGLAMEEPKAAVEELGRAYDQLREMERGLLAQSLQRDFYEVRRQVEKVYEETLLGLSRLEPEYLERAYAVGEWVRARQLREMLRYSSVKGLPPMLPELASRLEAAEDRQSRSLAGSLQHREASAELRALIDEYAQMQAETLFGQGEGDFEDDFLLSLDQAQREFLDPETSLWIFRVGEEGGRVWVVSQSSVEVISIDGATIVQKVEILRRGIQDLREVRGVTLETLSKHLLGPIWPHLKGTRRVVIVPDGPLHLLPFALLPLPPAAGGVRDEVLVDRFELVKVPSLSVLSMLRERAKARGEGSGRVAVLADPVFQTGDARLANVERAESEPLETDAPESELSTSARGVGDLERVRAAFEQEELSRLEASGEEGKAITEIWRGVWGEASDLIEAHGLLAQKELLSRQEVRTSEVLHFATHAFAHPQFPELSGIILSLFAPDGQPVDGLLRAYEIAHLPLEVELVVVSSCNSGIGLLSSAGPSSLGWSFLSAGARQVVVSLWEVGDQATRELMRRFYEALWGEGLAPAAALRQAQVELRNHPKYRAPFYWAGFELQGDWQSGLKKKAENPINSYERPVERWRG